MKIGADGHGHFGAGGSSGLGFGVGPSGDECPQDDMLRTVWLSDAGIEGPAALKMFHLGRRWRTLQSYCVLDGRWDCSGSDAHRDRDRGCNGCRVSDAVDACGH